MTFFKENITSASIPVTRKNGFYHPRSLIWMASALAVILLQRILPSSFFDQWYYQGVFLWFRQGYDYLLGWSPVPMIYIAITLILLRIARWMGQWKKKGLYQFSRALGGVGALVTFFYIFWGFNYGQIPLHARLGFDLENVQGEDIESEFKRASLVLKAEAESLPVWLTGDKELMHFKINDKDLRPDVEFALAQLGLPCKGRVRVRQLWPKGLLLRWNTAGIYIPQTGEGHVDLGLLSVQKPFTIAHEMAHGYGVTDEGACNFIAWLACSRSDDPWIRFAGALTYWRYTAAEMPSDSVSEILQTFPPVVLRALTLIRQNNIKYPDFMPKIRDSIYSSYLKRHGVKGGLRSYNYVVIMVNQYLESGSSAPQPE